MEPTPVLSYAEQKSIFNLLGKNVMLINEEDSIEMVSKGILELLNVSETEILGKKCYDILFTSIQDQNNFKRSLNRGNSFQIKYRINN